jgi:translation initiation factor IF-3
LPVPKKFDRRPPERDTTRINDRIRVPEVRLIGEDGSQIGVVKTPEALRYAQERDLDLVEVAPEARPPVARVLDYSKYRYEQAQKQKAARKHQQQITIREIKFRPKIAQNDYDTKKGHVTRFLKNKDKVKITIMFRGREVIHPDRGVALLEKLSDELSELAVVEQQPLQDGRNMTMMLAPSKAVLSGEIAAKDSGKSDDATAEDAKTDEAKADDAKADDAAADGAKADEAKAHGAKADDATSDDAKAEAAPTPVPAAGDGTRETAAPAPEAA